MALEAKARDQVIRALLGESASEAPQSWLAVANVIKNRTDSGAWGDPLTPVEQASNRRPRRRLAGVSCPASISMAGISRFGMITSCSPARSLVRQNLICTGCA
jgi:hypothetical protein